MKNIFIILAFTHILFAQNSSYGAYSKEKIERNLFYVQLGAFSNETHALEVKKEFNFLPYSVTLKKRYIDTKNYYKLLIGPFSSYEKAKNIMEGIPNQDNKAFVYQDYLF